jgi:hypothetical protein
MNEKIITIVAECTTKDDLDNFLSNNEEIKVLKDSGWNVSLKYFETPDEYVNRKDDEKKKYIPHMSEIGFIRLHSNIRYVEDAIVNGENDDENNPRMPFIEKVNKDEVFWTIDIDANTGVVKNWPTGMTAQVHYKSCDENDISFFGLGGNLLREVHWCYVPDFLSIEDSGYGDYIIINIDENGKIHNWELNDEIICDFLNDEDE